MPKYKYRWTPHALKELRTLYEDPTNATDAICEHFGITKTCLYSTVHRHNIHRVNPKSGVYHKSKSTGAMMFPVDPEHPRDDRSISQRLADLIGHVFSKRGDRRVFSDEQLLRYSENPLAMMKEVFDFKPLVGRNGEHFQEDLIKAFLLQDRVVAYCGRQIGKTETMAVSVAYAMLVEPESTHLLISSSQRSAQEFLERVKSFLFTSEPVVKGVTKNISTEVALDNKSRAVALPGGTPGIGSTLRGFARANIWFDESCHASESEVMAAVSPSRATTKALTGRAGRLILASTPFGNSGETYNIYHKQNSFVKFSYKSDISPLISPDFLAEERENLGERVFLQEYCAVPVDDIHSFFPTSLIKEVLSDDLDVTTSLIPASKKSKVTIGCDWSRGIRDRACLAVCERPEGDKPWRILHLRFWVPQNPPMDEVAVLSDLVATYQPSAVIADKSGYGEINMFCEANPKVFVKPIDFTQAEKLRLFSNFKALLSGGRLTLPKVRELELELQRFESRISDSGRVLLHASAGGHDDIVDSIALAVDDISELEHKPKVIPASAFWIEAMDEGESKYDEDYLKEKRRRLSRFPEENEDRIVGSWRF